MISAVVLCGGDGRRFGGTDKPLLELGGRPLVAHVLERLADQADEVLISANRHAERYAAFGVEVVPDRLRDVGPLAGIDAALPHCRGEFLFVCPGDSPAVAADLIARLRDSLLQAGPAAAVAIPNDGQRDQVLFPLLRRAAADTVSTYLAKGERSVFGWLDTLRSVRCPVPDGASFCNVNTAEDLAALEARWHSQTS